MCYTVVVASEKCDNGHPIVSQNHKNQQTCWRQCRLKAYTCSIRHRRKPNGAVWDICENPADRDPEAYIIILDDGAKATQSPWECKICRGINGSPEIREVQSTIDRLEEYLKSLPRIFGELEEKLSLNSDQNDVVDLMERISALELMENDKSSQLRREKKKLADRKAWHVFNGKEDVIEVAWKSATIVGRPCVYMGSQKCVWEKDHKDRKRNTDWPVDFMPYEDLEIYKDVDEPPIVPF